MRQARRNLKSTAAVRSCAAARFTWTHGRGIAWDCVSLIGWLPHLSVCASGCLSVSKLAVCLLACLSAGREAKAVAVASWGDEPGNPHGQRHAALSRMDLPAREGLSRHLDAQELREVHRAHHPLGRHVVLVVQATWLGVGRGWG